MYSYLSQNYRLRPGDVKSAARTLQILEILAKFPEGLSLTEIEKRLGIPISSLHGLMLTLVNWDFATKTHTSNIYRLGPKLVQLALSYRSQSDLVSIVDPFMMKLKQQTAETVSLTVLQGNMILFIHKHTAEGRVQIVNPVGTRLHAHASGSGKVMLAYLSEDEIDKLYPEEELVTPTKNTIKTRSELKEELAEIKRLEYAFDKEESEIGVWAVAGCIRDPDGNPIAALSVAAPVFRLSGTDYREWPRYIIESAREASLQFQLTS
jgi:DNA-binding IclR family transcriptional regulator